MQGRTVGKAAQPTAHDENAYRHSQHETNQYDTHKLGAKHDQDVADAASVHAAYADFLAAILGLENHQTKNAH